MNSKMSKRALLVSVMSLVLCVAMLTGTTFAWFTDQETSAGNKIIAGDLDVGLYLWTSATDSVEITSSSDPIFGGENSITANANSADTLWEPGKTQVVYLSIKNDGTLDLKYSVIVDVKSVTGELLEVLKYDIIGGATFGTVDRWTDGEYVVEGVNNTEAVNTHLIAGHEDFFALAIHMDENAGNKYMNGQVEFDITVLAAQLNSEEDAFGPDYDESANHVTSVATLSAFFNALETGSDMRLDETIVVDEAFVNYMNDNYGTTTFTLLSTIVDSDAEIDGGGITISRTEETKNEPLIVVKSGYTLTLSNITLDGGAVWSGDVDETLLRGTENTGMVAGGALISVEGTGKIVLEEGAILQNNDGANAVSLVTRAGGSLVLDGGEIINNTSSAGAIWGGGKITVNSGKINGNNATSIGGAIRMVDGYNNGSVSFTMNGGEMNHNKSNGTGGAIWGGNRSTYTFTGGEMAYNSATAGGAIWTGTYEKYNISGDFKLHDNKSTDLGAAIRFCDHSSLTMTGGAVYNNLMNGESYAFYLNNNSANISGGSIADNFSYSGGLGLTIGKAEIEGVITYNLGTNHNTAYLASEFNGFSFTVNESASNFSQFNFKPAAEYVYTAGDEAKLICLNEGYTTYWDAATNTFRLQAD